MQILVTGAAGFIGCHLVKRLLEDGHRVTGIDNLNAYYSVQLKRDRLAFLAHPKFSFHCLEIAEQSGLSALFGANKFSHVVHLAAQAGVRYSLDNPSVYVQSNLVAFANLLECCREHPVEHLVYASSSSVYGLNAKMPFSVRDNVDHPVSLYAATKKSNELMAHAYSYLYDLPTTGLRLFTVYGPWGRPDMALFKFTKAILAGEPIDVYSHGQMKRDFTYIDDIIEGVVRVLHQPPAPDPLWDPCKPDPGASLAPYRICNIGNNNAISLDEFIATLEQTLGKRAVRNNLPLQPGDVPATYADISDLAALVGFSPATSLKTGIERFVAWYCEYYNQIRP